MLFMENLPAFGDIAGHLGTYYQHYLMVILLFALLGYASYTDIKELKISNKLNLAIVLVRLALIPFFGISYYNLLGFAFCFGLFLLVGVITYTSMGGDIKCAGAMGFFLGLHNSVLVVISACVLAIVYSIIRKIAKRGKYFPFAPFFLGGYLVVTIAYYIIQFL